jgi:hypothetical protein
MIQSFERQLSAFSSQPSAFAQTYADRDLDFCFLTGFDGFWARRYRARPVRLDAESVRVALEDARVEASSMLNRLFADGNVQKYPEPTPTSGADNAREMGHPAKQGYLRMPSFPINVL